MSIASNLFQGFFALINFKEIVSKQFKNPPRNTGTMDLVKFNRRLKPEFWEVDGFKLITINRSNDNNKHLIYLPGGAYTLEASSYHKRFMEKLANNHGLTITLIDYPKTPEHTYRTTINLVTKAYRQIVKSNPGNDFIILGDSAGGGLGLALLQVLRDEKIAPFPRKTVLISPWLDLSLSEKRIKEQAAKDYLLPVGGLIYVGKLYSGGEDLCNPLLSPIYGDLSNLGRVLLFCGTKEIFYPDCLNLMDKLSNSQGTTLQSAIGRNMFHAWVIFPLPESNQAVKQIAKFILTG